MIFLQKVKPHDNSITFLSFFSMSLSSSKVWNFELDDYFFAKFVNLELANLALRNSVFYAVNGYLIFFLHNIQRSATTMKLDNVKMKALSISDTNCISLSNLVFFWYFILLAGLWVYNGFYAKVKHIKSAIKNKIFIFSLNIFIT